MLRNVRIEGLDELKKKLNADVLVQPEMDDAMETFTRRVVDRPGKGLGAKRNALSETRNPLSATVGTTLTFPRTTGASWAKKNTSVIRAMSARVMNKAVQRIEERWASK